MSARKVWPYEMVWRARELHAGGMKAHDVRRVLFREYHPLPSPELSTVREWLRNRNRKAA